MMDTTKRFLFLVRRAPLGGAYLRETLDMVLTTAAFDQPISLLFLDDGVFQLFQDTALPVEEQPEWAAMLKALELYDLPDILVERESLSARGLDETELALAARPVAGADVKEIIVAHDVVVVC